VRVCDALLATRAALVRAVLTHACVCVCVCAARAPHTVLVYKRDRERRKDKLQQKQQQPQQQQSSSVASGAGSAMETPRGAHGGASVTASVEMSMISGTHTPPSMAGAATSASPGASMDVRASPALSYEQRVGQPGSGNNSPAGAASRGSPSASATGSRPVSIRAATAATAGAATATAAAAGAGTVTYDSVPLQQVVGVDDGIGAGEVMVTTVESSNALVPDKAGAGGDGNDSDDGSLSLPVPAGFHVAGAGGPDSATSPMALPPAGAGHDAFPSAASAGRSAAASTLPSHGSRVMAASQLQEVVSELFKFHDHSQSRNLTMVSGRCACLKRLRRRLQVYSQRRRDPNPLFRASLKEIDGHYGSSIVSFFVFSRWLIMLNIGLALLWLLFIILPFVIGAFILGCRNPLPARHMFADDARACARPCSVRLPQVGRRAHVGVDGRVQPVRGRGSRGHVDVLRRLPVHVRIARTRTVASHARGVVCPGTTTTWPTPSWR
jgi:hypothetical protein